MHSRSNQHINYIAYDTYLINPINDKQKIGFFTVVPRKVGGQGESSSTCQSDDEDISGDFLSDSATTSDSDTDSEEGEGGAAFPSSHAHRGRRTGRRRRRRPRAGRRRGIGPGRRCGRPPRRPRDEGRDGDRGGLGIRGPAGP